jgi:hypothetical protein
MVDLFANRFLFENGGDLRNVFRRFIYDEYLLRARNRTIYLSGEALGFDLRNRDSNASR